MKSDSIMPYRIEKRGDKFCVVRRDTGENKGCSDTRAEAQRHMNAMLAGEHGKAAMDDCMKQHMADLKKKNPNMSEADMMTSARQACKESKMLEAVDLKAWNGRFVSQQEANYVPLSATPGQACANCRWFSAAYDRCFIVEDYPEPILATGHSNRWEAVPQAVVLEAEPIPVVIVEPPMNMDDSAEMALSVPKSMVERVKEFVSSLRPGEKLKDQTFQVMKTSNGKMAWIARHTGKWIDREKEILADKAHDRYLARVEKGEVPLPELWMWHNAGTKHGHAIAVWKSGGFVLAAGFIDDTAEGRRMFDYYQKNSGKIKLSHMFHYPVAAKIDGVYYDYTYTKEITTLPDGAEAFPYTSFEEIRTMALPKQAEDMILEAGGQEMLDRARQADSKAGTDSKILDGQGVASKGKEPDVYDQAQIALETRLKAVDDQLKALGDIPATFAQFNESIKQLNDKLETELKVKADLIEKINDLEKKAALLTDLKPPASQSSETLLNEREKSMLDTVMAEASKNVQKSLIETLVGGQPTIQS